MDLILVTGGARAGKSTYAQRRAFEAGGDAVTYVAAARPSDDDMIERIERHRRDRPVRWATIEAPRAAAGAVLDAPTDVVLLECLTVLAGNAVGDTRPQSAEEALDAIDAEAAAIEAVLGQRPGLLIVVTNEVGLGVHPPTALGRWYQDALGRANQRLAHVASEVVMVVSGLPVVLKSPVARRV